MAVSLDHSRQTPLPPPPPPLSISNASPTDTNDNTRGSGPYPTPSSSSTSRPTLNLPPTSSVDTSKGQSVPTSTSTMVDGRIYSLDVMQQPVRARMCGFGDKDRRPITPPPCIRLIVQDAETRQEVDINEIDTSYLVLTVDLWSSDSSKEVNLVRHSATSPSISAATASSYPPPADDVSTAAAYQVPLQAVSISTYPGEVPGTYGYARGSPHHGPLPPPPPPQAAPSSSSSANVGTAVGYYSTPMGTPATPTGVGSMQGQGPLLSPAASCDPRSHPSGMFTRNLIGSLCVSAFKLTDPRNNMGVWFILQDLSVRTEGSFRLKMNFVNVGSPNQGQILNTASAPVLASCFSNEFHVYSAKKFPGVIESTELSKCFATQGIKIPIRKDGVRGNERRPGEGEDDE